MLTERNSYAASGPGPPLGYDIGVAARHKTGNPRFVHIRAGEKGTKSIDDGT